MRYFGRMTMAVLVLASVAQAQSWQEFVSRDFRFHINFPGEPKVDDIAYTSADGTTHKARQFHIENERGRYSLTVVDFSQDPAHEQAPATALAPIRAKGKPVYDQPANVDGRPGHQVFVDTPDGWKIVSGAFLYDHRIYIAEGASPPGAPPPTQFQQSLMFVDENDKQLVNNRFRQAEPPAANTAN
jgi:hypothetical protein